MIVIGLTGSIGMGKSTTARMLRRLGLPVHDADASVHRLMQAGGAAVAPLLAAFPSVASPEGGIDRAALRGQVVGHPVQLKRLESIVHPLVKADRQRFLARERQRRAPVVVLDVPLLFESGSDKDVDAVWVVSAPAFLQRQRVMARSGMSAAVFSGLLGRQMPDYEKRRRADWIIPTGLGLAVTERRLRHLLRELKQTPKGQVHA